jgi:hypothetical protein
MPLPPKGDPRRPLHLAVRSSRVLGAAFALIGIWWLLSLRPGISGRVTPARVWATISSDALVGAFGCFGPAFCHLAVAPLLSNYRRRAVTVALMTASLHLLFLLFITARSGFSVLTTATFHPLMVLPLTIVVLFLVSLGQLIHQLARSYESVRLSPFGRDKHHGFALVFPADQAPGRRPVVRLESPPQQT